MPPSIIPRSHTGQNHRLRGRDVLDSNMPAAKASFVCVGFAKTLSTDNGITQSI
jgi:hypothetical protein